MTLEYGFIHINFTPMEQRAYNSEPQRDTRTEIVQFGF